MRRGADPEYGAGAAAPHHSRRTHPARDPGCRTSTHLLDRLDAEDQKPRREDEGDRLDEGEARLRQGEIVGDDEAESRLVLALVPEAVEGGGDLAEIEGDAVRFMRLGGALDEAWPARQQAYEAKLGRIGKALARPAGERRRREILAREVGPRMAKHRGRARMRVLHVEDRIVFRLLRHLGEIEIEQIGR